MTKKEKSLFWASYADLMTSLFFVMLLLFVGTIVILDNERGYFERMIEYYKHKYEASEEEKRIIEEINNATKSIDAVYFDYKEEYKKHKLKIEVNYQINDYNIDNLPDETKNKLLKAGKSLKDFVSKTTKGNPNIQYLLIIEGQASRLGTPELNYPLSYQRAYGLKKFWEDNNLRFTARNCEVLICGSGDGTQSGTGLMREPDDPLNQRFLIHILPKPGQTDEIKTSNSSGIAK